MSDWKKFIMDFICMLIVEIILLVLTYFFFEPLVKSVKKNTYINLNKAFHNPETTLKFLVMNFVCA